MSKRRDPRPFEHIHDSTGAFRGKEDPVSPIAEITKHFGIDWRIYWYWGMRESGELKVDFIARTPDPAPAFPYLPKIMEIFGSSCNHVECVPEFVSAGSGWRYWVVTLSAKECSIQALLLGPRPKCGCDPWLNSSTSGEVYESLREWLKGLDESANIRAH